MELTGEQLKDAEIRLRGHLPRSLLVYGYLVQINRVHSDPVQVFVDTWPHFNVIICKPLDVQKGDTFKDILVFTTDDALMAQTIRKSSILDWTRFLCLAITQQQMAMLQAVASEKHVSSNKRAVCHMMVLEDVSRLPSIDSSGVSVGSLDESHISLVNQTWKFSRGHNSVNMLHNMIANFPSCCVLDAERRPVSWILIYASCAMGVLYTLPEHRGKGYAKIVISTMAKRLHAEEYPVYCFIEEENLLSQRLFKNMGFTEDPTYRQAWVAVNEPSVDETK